MALVHTHVHLHGEPLPAKASVLSTGTYALAVGEQITMYDTPDVLRAQAHAMLAALELAEMDHAAPPDGGDQS
jgi:hypothetical protein